MWVSITQVWHEVFRGCLVHVFVDNDTARAWGGHPPSTRTSAASQALVLSLQRTLALHLQESNCTLVMHRIPTHCNSVADHLSRAPTVASTRDVIESWAAQIASEVTKDQAQRQASLWLAARRAETPLLWWDTKPTLLTARAPHYLKYLFPDYDQLDPHTFHRRPLLHSLMQRPVKEDWQHHLLDRDTAAAWLRSQRGHEEQRQ